MSGQQHAPAALYPRERPGTHCTGGWVGPRDLNIFLLYISNQDTILSYELMCGLKESFAILRVVVRGHAQRLDLGYLK